MFEKRKIDRSSADIASDRIRLTVELERQERVLYERLEAKIDHDQVADTNQSCAPSENVSLGPVPYVDSEPSKENSKTPSSDYSRFSRKAMVSAGKDDCLKDGLCPNDGNREPNLRNKSLGFDREFEDRLAIIENNILQPQKEYEIDFSEVDAAKHINESFDEIPTLTEVIGGDRHDQLEGKAIVGSEQKLTITPLLMSWLYCQKRHGDAVAIVELVKQGDEYEPKHEVYAPLLGDTEGAIGSVVRLESTLEIPGKVIHIFRPRRYRLESSGHGKISSRPPGHRPFDNWFNQDGAGRLSVTKAFVSYLAEVTFAYSSALDDWCDELTTIARAMSEDSFLAGCVIDAKEATRIFSETGVWVTPNSELTLRSKEISGRKLNVSVAEILRSENTDALHISKYIPWQDSPFELILLHILAGFNGSTSSQGAIRAAGLLDCLIFDGSLEKESGSKAAELQQKYGAGLNALRSETESSRFIPNTVLSAKEIGIWLGLEAREGNLSLNGPIEISEIKSALMQFAPEVLSSLKMSNLYRQDLMNFVEDLFLL